MSTIFDYLKDSIESLVVQLLGKPNPKHSKGKEWRWGNKGSFAVSVSGNKAGTWFDHEAGVGGGPLDLIKRKLDLNDRGAREWAMERAGGSLEVWTPPSKPPTPKVDEDLGMIEKARRLWAESVPITGTEGERYLRGRGITCGFDRVRFLPTFWYEKSKSLPAIIFKTTGAAVQVIVIKDGRKAPIDNPKRTYGKLTGPVILQDGPGPFILAEGPETALSAIVAGVSGTVMAVLSVSNFAKFGTSIPTDNVLLIGDGDPVHSPSRKTLEEAAREIAETGCAVHVLDLPPTGNDLNDILQKKGPNLVRQLVEAALAGSPWCDPEAKPAILPLYPDRGRPLAEAERELKTSIDEFFDVSIPQWQLDRSKPTPQVGLNVATATGKTEVVLRAIVRTERPGVIAVPLNSLSRGLEGRMNSLAGYGISGAWFGPSQPDPKCPGESMCRFAERLSLVEAAGGTVADLCGSEKSGRCEFHDICGYHRQRRERPRVRIIPNCKLGSKRPDEIQAGDFLILDEAFDLIEGDGARPYTVPIEDLALGPRTFKGGPDSIDAKASAEVLKNLLDAFTDGQEGPLHRKSFEKAGLTAGAARAMSALEWQSRTEKVEGPDLRTAPLAELKKRLTSVGSTFRTIARRVRFWKQIAKFLDSPQIESVELSRHGKEVRIRWREEIDPSWLETPILHMNATMEPSIVRQWLPRLEVAPAIEVAPDPEGVFVRMVLWYASAAKLFPGEPEDGQAPNKYQRTARGHRAELIRALEVLASRFRGKGAGEFDILFVGQLALVCLLKAEFRAELERWGKRIAFEHFNNTRGRDEFRGVACEFVVGQTHPQVRTVESRTSVIFGETVEAIPDPPPGGWLWYPKVPAGIRMQDGTSQVTMAERHPDPRVEAVRRSIVESEVLQSIGRGRGNRRTKDNPLEIIVVSSLALPLTVDRVETWEEFLPTPVDLMGARGVVPLSWGGVALVLPDLFETPEAARQWFKTHPQERKTLRGLKSGQTPIDVSLIGERPVFEAPWTRVEYRPLEGNSTVAWVRGATLLEVQANLEKYTGPLRRVLTPVVSPPVPLPQERPSVPPAPPTEPVVPPPVAAPDPTWGLPAPSKMGLALTPEVQAVDRESCSKMLRNPDVDAAELSALRGLANETSVQVRPRIETAMGQAVAWQLRFASGGQLFGRV